MYYQFDDLLHQFQILIFGTCYIFFGLFWRCFRGQNAKKIGSIILNIILNMLE